MALLLYGSSTPLNPSSVVISRDGGGFNQVIYLKSMSNTTKTILHLCADTGSDTRPYQRAGYNVVLVGSNIGVENYHHIGSVHGIIANPVCTEFSAAAGKHLRKDHEQGLLLVHECQRIIRETNPSFWVIENPATGRLRDYLGKPTMEYEPCIFLLLLIETFEKFHLKHP